MTILTKVELETENSRLRRKLQESEANFDQLLWGVKELAHEAAKSGITFKDVNRLYEEFNGRQHKA